MNKEKPTIAFDLDGTLLNVDKRCYVAYTMAIPKNAQAISEHEFYELKKKSTSTRELISRVCTPQTEKEHQNAYITFLESPECLSYDTVHVFVPELLLSLNTHFNLAIATLRRNKNNLINQLHTLGIDRFFQRIDNHPADAHPDQTKATMLRSWPVTPLAIIGDTEADIGAGKLLEITTIAVLWGQRSSEHIASLHPDYIATAPGDIPKYLAHITQQ